MFLSGQEDQRLLAGKDKNCLRIIAFHVLILKSVVDNIGVSEKPVFFIFNVFEERKGADFQQTINFMSAVRILHSVRILVSKGQERRS
jgi:hypothetical protein